MYYKWINDKKKTDPYISSVINATRVISGQLSKHEKGEVFIE